MKTPQEFDKLAIDAIALAEKALPGPWSCDATDPGDVVIWGNNSELVMNVGQPISRVGEIVEGEKETGDLIAASRTLIPELAQAVLDLARICRFLAGELSTYEPHPIHPEAVLLDRMRKAETMCKE